MPVITHQSPMGAIDVPSLYRGEWLPGDEHEVTDEQARACLEQYELFLPVDATAKRIAAELKADREKEDEPADPAPADPPADVPPPADDPKDD